VVEVGAVAKSMNLFKPGDRVVVNPVQHCNACYACAAGNTNLCANLYVPGVTANGGFAEYCTSRYTGLFKLPDSVSFAAGARSIRHQETGSRTGPVCGRLRAGPDRPDDGTTHQVRGCGQGGSGRHARLSPGGR
jgi:hypothetical protein